MSITDSGIRSRAHVLIPLVWSAYIAVRVPGWGWLDGLPLAPLEAAALALVWWAWAVDRRLPGAWPIAALLVVKIALGALLVARGFEARYYANAAWAPPLERSTEYRAAEFTRRDERLAFSQDRAPGLPLYFLNDVRRFNFAAPGEPRRELLAYSVVWTGALRVERETAPTLYVIAGDSAIGELSIDGRPVVVLDRVSPRRAATRLEPGWHALTLRVAAPYPATRRIEAGVIAGDEARPFDGTDVFVARVSDTALAIDRLVRAAAYTIDATVLASLAWIVLIRARRSWRDRRAVPLLWLVAGAEAFRYAWPYVSRAVMLSGSNDWLIYETYARAILLDSVVRAGQDTAFVFQPLYPYVLALLHQLSGEDLFGIVAVQRVLVAATAAGAAAIASALFGRLTAIVAACVAVPFLYQTLGAWSSRLLAEPVFTPVLVAWVWLLVTSAARPSPPSVLLTGIVGGIATLTRSTLLLAWPVALPIWWASLRTRTVQAAAVLLAGMAGVVGLATARNFVVTGQFVLITVSGSYNLLLGNPSPRPLDPPTAARAALYDRLDFDASTRTVAEFVVQEPAAFARGLGRKALYSIGLYDLSGVGDRNGTSWWYLAAWVLTTAGVWRLVRAPAWRASPAVWLPLVCALTHLAAVIVIFPWGYGDRLIVPLYPLLLPYAAVALEPVAGRIQPHVEVMGHHVAAAGALSAHRLARALLPIVTDARRLMAPLVAPALRSPAIWLYLAYAGAAAARLDVRPDRDETSLAVALILPITAALVSLLARRDRVRDVLAVAVFALSLALVGGRGSQSPRAAEDPLFWAAAAVAAFGVSAAIRRRPVAAAAIAATAGGFTAVAALIPLLPPASADSLFAPITAQLGIVATALLLAMVAHAIVAGARRSGGRAGAAARGALLAIAGAAALGAVPAAAGLHPAWLAALGVLAGLATPRGEVRIH